MKKQVYRSVYRITRALCAYSYRFAERPSVRFSIKRFLFRHANATRAEEYRAGRGVRPRERAQCVKSGVLARCVEIERFMPELIDSPCYYELYDFYEKSVLTALHVARSSFLLLFSHSFSFPFPIDFVVLPMY